MEEIVTVPNKVLSVRSQDITEFNEDVKKLVQRLFDKLATLDGLGLAAPQIGESKNVAVLYFDPTDKKNKKDREAVAIPRTVLINPKIVWRSNDIAVEKEACFSIPKGDFSVPRAKKIHVETYDESGKRHKIKARGLYARAIQHEMDHLQGTVVADYEK